MAVLVPIPTTASLTVTDIGGSSVGGGPWTITRGKSISSPLEGVKIESGPFLTTGWKEQIIGSKFCNFQLVLEPDMGITTSTFQWNSVDQSQLMWWTRAFNNGSSLSFIYGPASATPSTTNLVWTIHIRAMNVSPSAPGNPDNLTELTIEMMAAYVKIDDGVSAIEKGVAIT